ncbi:MAG: c-type cytochrome, partial [Nitrospina sp.]|nr:c-type cytochrome [Nitrospina sp.]
MKILAFFVLTGLLLLAPALANAGILQDKDCGSCHRLGDSEKKISGPDLHYAGNKFQAKWLKQFLQNPEVIRP